MEFLSCNKNDSLEKSLYYVSQAAFSHLSFIYIIEITTTDFVICTNMYNELFTVVRPMIMPCEHSIMCFLPGGDKTNFYLFYSTMPF